MKLLCLEGILTFPSTDIPDLQWFDLTTFQLYDGIKGGMCSVETILWSLNSDLFPLLIHDTQQQLQAKVSSRPCNYEGKQDTAAYCVVEQYAIA